MSTPAVLALQTAAYTAAGLVARLTVEAWRGLAAWVRRDLADQRQRATVHRDD